MYLEETQLWKDTCSPTLTALLFTVTKSRKQPKCPLTDDWIKKWDIYIYILIRIYIYFIYIIRTCIYIHTHTHTHTDIYLSQWFLKSVKTVYLSSGSLSLSRLTWTTESCVLCTCFHLCLHLTHSPQRIKVFSENPKSDHAWSSIRP